jgi:nucleotide-binding universal stress UspA family protein
VVVGVDGSAGSLAAVAVAANETALRHRPLRVVHAFIWPYFDIPLGPPPAGLPEGGLRHAAERLLAEAVDCARAAAPEVTVTGELVTGGAAAVLERESHAAALVVIGDRGLGGFTGLLVGSVAVQLAAHAACPILVVRGDPARHGEILLGVDGSPVNQPAVGYAFEEAALRGVALTALHAWTHPVANEPGDMLELVYDLTEVETDETRLLAEALAGWREKYPEVVVHRRVVRQRTRAALINASSRAQLVVVGARGRGGFAGLLLGSVSQAILHHADCPVAIIRRTG